MNRFSAFVCLLCSIIAAAAQPTWPLQQVQPSVPQQQNVRTQPEPRTIPRQRLHLSPQAAPLAATIRHVVPQRAETAGGIYVESFETSGAWTIEDAAELMRTGAQIQNVRAIDGDRYMTSGYDLSPRHASAVSPVVPLEGGVEHYVSLWVFAPGYGAQMEEFKVYAIDPATDTRTLLFDYSGSRAEKIKNWKFIETTFTPPLGGPYQFEILHCTQEENVNLVAFDRFFVGRTPDTYRPGQPTVVSPPAHADYRDVVYTTATKYTYKYEIRTQLAYGEGDSVFVRGLCPSMPKAWVWGRRTGQRIAFPKGQYVGIFQGGQQYDIYFTPAQSYEYDEYGNLTYLPVDSLLGTIDDDARIRIDAGMITVESADGSGTLDMAEHQRIDPFDRVYCYPPDDATRTQMQYSTLLNAQFPSYRLVEIAERGEEVYVCGFCEDAKMTWLKGYKEGNDIVLPSGQYMGMMGDYPITFTGVELDDVMGFKETSEFVMERAPDGSCHTDQLYQTQINDGYNGSYVYFGTELKPYVLQPERPNPPVEVIHETRTETPYIQLQYDPLNVKGYLMSLDDLYFRIYLDGKLFRFNTTDYPYLPEATNEIGVTYTDPWNFFDYGGTYTKIFSFDSMNYTELAVEMVYHLDGQTLLSDRFVIQNPTVGISAPAEAPLSVSATDLQGRRISPETPGLQIRTSLFPDGSVRRQKVFVR